MDAAQYRDASGRRRFLTMIGMAGLASSLGIGRALAQGAAPVPTPPTPAAPATPAAPEISEDAKAFAAIVERRYGTHLVEGDLKEITEELEFRIQNGKRLRGAALTNADEPDATFHP